jgi:protein disulfide-isomerase
MKKIIVLFVLFFAMQAVQSQELKWHTNVKEAIAIGNKEHKPLMMFWVVIGVDGASDYKSVIDSEFAKWAAGNVILVELDYPRRTPQALEVKKQNNELQQAFGIQGFQQFFANGVDTEGKVNFEGLGSTGYVAGGPEAWLAIANGILKRIIFNLV